MSVAELAYRLTSSFPKDETYGMTSQIRRAAASVAANIAEGYGRDSGGAFVQFLRMSQGSLKELETHLLLAARVKLARQNEIDPLLSRCEELGKMLRALIRAIQRKHSDG
jgi:four helix bundle protein